MCLHHATTCSMPCRPARSCAGESHTIHPGKQLAGREIVLLRHTGHGERLLENSVESVVTPPMSLPSSRCKDVDGTCGVVLVTLCPAIVGLAVAIDAIDGNPPLLLLARLFKPSCLPCWRLFNMLSSCKKKKTDERTNEQKSGKSVSHTYQMQQHRPLPTNWQSD